MGGEILIKWILLLFLKDFLFNNLIYSLIYRKIEFEAVIEGIHICG